MDQPLEEDPTELVGSIYTQEKAVLPTAICPLNPGCIPERGQKGQFVPGPLFERLPIPEWHCNVALQPGTQGCRATH